MTQSFENHSKTTDKASEINTKTLQKRSITDRLGRSVEATSILQPFFFYLRFRRTDKYSNLKPGNMTRLGHDQVFRGVSVLCNI